MPWFRNSLDPWKNWLGWGWGHFSFLNPYRLRRSLEDGRKKKNECKPEKNKEKQIHTTPPPGEKKNGS